jgi:lipocalin
MRFNLPSMALALSSAVALLLLDPTTVLLVDAQEGEECPVVDTVADFDIDQYASAPWYIHQQAVTSYSPEDENFCVVANYTILEKSTPWGYTVGVDNKARDEFGDTRGGKLCAFQTDDAPSKLAVAPCFLPKFFAGPYWVVAYNEDEGYALISGGQPTIPADPENIKAGCRTGTGTNNSGLWIFSRSQVRDDALVSKVRGIAQEKGFDLSVLNDVDQADCEEPCEDSDERFNKWYNWWLKKCTYVGHKPESRCDDYADICPETCGLCE